MTQKLVFILHRINPIRFWRDATASVRAGLLLVLIAMVCAVPLYFFVCQSNEIVVLARQEQQGLKPIQMQLAIIQRSQQHRGLAARYLLDETMTRKEMRAKGEEVEEAIVNFETKSKSFRSSELRRHIDKQTALWHAVSQDVDGKTINYEQSFARHTELIANEFDSLYFILNDYRLILDSEIDSYYLIAASLVDLPRLTELLGQMRALGVASLSKGSASFQERAQIKALLIMSQQQMASLDNSVRRAVEANKGRDIEINSYQNVAEQYKKITALVQEKILSREHFDYSPMDYYSNFTLAINTGYGFAQISGNQIFDVLQQRINKERSRMFKVIGVCASLYLLLALVLFSVIRRGFERLE